MRDCGKMALLDRLLRHLLPGGHKVLIFSQMTSMLALVDRSVGAGAARGGGGRAERARQWVGWLETLAMG